MRGQEVQFNIDKDIARALNPVLSTEQDLRNILKQTSLDPGVATTNSEGDVSALLVVGDLGLQVPVVIDVMGTTRTLVFTAGTAPAPGNR